MEAVQVAEDQAVGVLVVEDVLMGAMACTFWLANESTKHVSTVDDLPVAGSPADMELEGEGARQPQAKAVAEEVPAEAGAY